MKRLGQLLPKTIVIGILVIFSGLTSNATNITAPDTIWTNTTWSVDTVFVKSNVYLHGVRDQYFATLTINPGTIILADSNCSFEIYGYLLANGTASDSILFTASNSSKGWGGIKFRNAYQTDSSKISYSIFEHCKYHSGTDTVNGWGVDYGALSIGSYDNVSISNCRFSHNIASNMVSGIGGAIVISWADPIIENNLFSFNQARRGGGISIYGGSPIINNNVFYKNIANYGGAINEDGHYPVISNNYISNNIADSTLLNGVYPIAGEGGGIYSAATDGTYFGNIIVNNSAELDGGACWTIGTPKGGFNNNTICNNRAGRHGGALWVRGTSSDVMNNIIYGNVAKDSASGHQLYFAYVGTNPDIQYNDIQGGYAEIKGPGTGLNFTGTYTNNVEDAPVFRNPSTGVGFLYDGLNKDWSIDSSNTFLINKGNADTSGMSIPELDFAGNPRIFNGRIDIGAYENQQPIYVCGNITENTVWDADTIKVNCDITIEDSFTLTIMPGTYVQFQGQYIIDVNGRLLALGTADERITFSIKDTTSFYHPDTTSVGWRGIYIDNIASNNDTSKLLFCDITHVRYYGYVHAIAIGNWSKVIVSHCRISNNWPKYGSTFSIVGCSPVISNNIICNNFSAFYILNSNSEFTNNIVVNNDGQGVDLRSSAAIFKNNIIWGNSWTSGSNLSSNSSQFYNNNTGFFGFVQLFTTYVNNIDVDPMFVAPTQGVGPLYDGINADWSLSPESPCINAGYPSSTGLGSTDMAGNNRIVGDTVDMGAYEAQISRKFITSHPLSTTVCENTTANFNVITSSASFSYQWIYNGVDIPGGTSASLKVDSIALSDTGYYYCALTNDFGTIYTDSAQLFVWIAPTFLIHPQHINVCQGDSVTFVAQSYGTEPITYKWYNNSAQLLHNRDTFTINSVNSNHVKSYYCVATNTCGTTQSNVSNLSMKTPPTITSLISSQTVCEDQSHSFSAYATGSSPLTYQWYKDNNAIQGANSNSYSITSLDYSDGGLYYCKASNSCGDDSTNISNLTVNLKPELLSQSSSSSICEGQSISLYVTASGSQPLTYQWYKDNVLIPSGTNNFYLINSATSSDAGTYKCIVSNVCGSVTSSDIIISINTSPSITAQSTNATQCSGSSHTFSITANGTAPLTYQWYFGNNPISSATNNTYTINSVATSDAGNYFCIVSNTCGNNQSTTKTLTVNEAPTITSQPSNANKCEGSNHTFIISAIGTAPISFQWYHDNKPITGAITSVLQISSMDTSNAGDYYCTATNSCGNITSSTASLTVTQSPVITAESTSATQCSGTSHTFSVTATGSSPLTYQWYFGNTAISSATNNTYTINSVAITDAGNYYCIVSNTCGTAQSSTKTLTVNEAPTISSQPVNASKCLGTNHTFLITATGTSPISYQWYQDNVAITGAITSVLQLNGILVSDAGDYYCEATNTCGNEKSSTARLTVNQAPYITAESSGATLCEGTAHTFSVTASGTSPLTYQWYFDNTSIPNATNNTYTISSVSTTDAGNYYCIVSNMCGKIQSSVKTLAVNEAPAITIQPNNAVKCVGNSHTSIVSVSGTMPVSYQWYHDNIAIKGAITSVLQLSNIDTSHAGNYHCEVSNLCGNILSNYINLTVNKPVNIIYQSSDSSKCEEDSTSFLVTTNGTQPLTYQWYKNTSIIDQATSNSYKLDELDNTDQGRYYCEISNVCGTKTSSVKKLTVHANPQVNLGKDTTFCKGGHIILSSGYGYFCKWNTGNINPQIEVTESGSYFVNVTDVYGCSAWSDTVNVNVSVPYAEENICLVTVDPVAGKNLVVWERTSGKGIVGYNIYKETTSKGTYEKIGYSPFDSVSIFLDVNSNPKKKADRYKITVIG
jgi:hypothetical protein